MWLSRFANYHVELIYTSDETKIRQLVQSKENLKFLVDYDLGPGSPNGLRLIRKFALGNRSVLVTSRTDESKIIEASQHTGAKILPKSLAPRIPIYLNG